MGERFYEDAALYDRLFPGRDASIAFYRTCAERAGGSVLELGCGTGQKLVPIAADGYSYTGLDSSSEMLARAQERADGRGVAVEWVQGDMRAFDLGRTFDLVVIAGNSLLHLHGNDDLLSCLRSVRAHLAPGGRLVLHVSNPDVALLAAADGARRTREDLTFLDPDRGEVRVEVAETYDAVTQVVRGTWHFSSAGCPEALVVPLELRVLFPQELAQLLATSGLDLLERFGTWDESPFAGDSTLQLCLCGAD